MKASSFALWMFCQICCVFFVFILGVGGGPPFDEGPPWRMVLQKCCELASALWSLTFDC